MFRDYSNYKVKINPVAYITKNGTRFESTASISFHDENRKEQAHYNLAYCDAESIYEMIDRKEPVILDECYIENFSLSEYRKSRGLEERSIVILNSFSAKSAFFEASVETDFSYSNIIGEGISFYKSRFINGRTSFHKTRFSGSESDFSNSIFKCEAIDFSNAVFEGGTVNFKSSHFLGGFKNFQYTDFGDGLVSFENVDFGDGDLNFVNTNFRSGNVTFKIARFGTGKKDFEFAQFGDGDVIFDRAEFGNGRVDFRMIEFSLGRVYFNRASFGDGDIAFDGSSLLNSRMSFKKTGFGCGKLSFEEVQFETSEVLFENVQFENGSIYFGKALFKSLSMVSCQLNHYVDFRVRYCGTLELSDSIARDIVDFSSYDQEVEIGTLNLAGMRLVGQIYIDWNKNNVKEIINNQDNTNNAEKAEQFRILKENYGRIGNYKSEDLAYIQFKRHEHKASLDAALEKSKLNAIWKLPIYALKLIIVDRMGLYATSPARVIFSLIIIYFGFSLIHFVSPYFFNTGITCIGEEMGIIHRFLNTLYYSLITFTTVGYGDCSPTGFLRSVAAVEGFVGPFMMSYFTVAFARKILR
jgi:hypothetical protein